MAALGSLVVKLALEYAQYSQGLNKADQEAMRFAQNAQKHFDAAKGAVGNFAVGMVAGAATAAAAALSVGAAIDGVKASIDRMDGFQKLSQKIGVPTEKLQELAHVADLSDVSLESLANGFKKLSIAAVDAAGGSEKAQAKFSAIGVSVTDANGKLRASDEVMADVADRFADMEDGAGKTALAIQIFGKQGADLIPMLNGGGKSFREAAEEARKFGLVVSGDALAAAERFNDNLTRLGKITEGTFNQVAEASLPVLGAFAEAMVEAYSGTDSLNDAAQRLNKDGTLQEWAEGAGRFIGFVVDAGQGVYRTFEIIGKTIGAAAAQVAALAQGDLAGAREIGKFWQSDIDAVLNRELFSSKLNAKLAELKKTIGESVAAGEKSDAPIVTSEDKTKEKLSDYQKLVRTLQEKTAVDSEQLRLGRELTEGEKIRAKFNADLSAGTVKMTASEKEHINVLIDGIDVSSRLVKTRKDQEKADKELVETEQKKLESLIQMMEKAEEEIEYYGLLPSKISAATAAKIDARVATLRLVEGTESENAATRSQIKLLEEQADAHRRIAGFQGSKESADASKKAAEDAFKEWKSSAEKIEGALTDALMRGFEGGKDWASSFRDTLVNMFKTMILRPMIQAIVQPVAGGAASMFGGGSGGGTVGNVMNAASLAGKLYSGYQAGGIGGAFSAATGIGSIGSSLGGYVSGFGNAIGSSSISAFGSGMGMSGAAAGEAAALYNGAGMASTGSALTTGSMVGTAAGIAGGIAGGVYGGRALSAGYSAFGGSGNSAVNTGTAIGAVVGSIIPVIGTAVGALIGGLLGGAVNRLFGHKDKEVTKFGVAGNFTGADGKFSDGIDFQHWTAKGGVFRSDKDGYDDAPIAKEIADAYSLGFKTLKDSSKEYAAALGLSADAVSGYSKSVVIELTKDDEENKKRITAQFTTMANEIAAALIPNIEQFAKTSEDASTTLARLVGSTRAVDTILAMMGRTSTEAFGAAGLAAAGAKQKLIDLSGGLDSFAAQADFFVSNFLTDSERMAPTIKAVADRMAELGNANVKTKEDFAALVKGLDLTKESNQQLYASLMALAPAFLQVANFASSTGESLALSNSRRQMEIDIMRLTGDESSALAAERAIELASMDASLRPMKQRIYALQDAAKIEARLAANVDAARGALSQAYERESSALRDTRDTFDGFAKSIRSFRAGLLGGDLSTLSPEQKYQQSKAAFDKTYTMAIAGDPKALAELESVSQQFLEASRGYNASSEQYVRDFERVRAALDSAATSADQQANIASAQLSALTQSVSGLLTLNGSVLSVRDAIAGLAAALHAQAAGSGVLNPGSTANDSDFVESLYKNYLGRDSDAAGLSFWLQSMAGGATTQDVINGFKNSDEYKTRKFAKGGVFTNGVVSQPTNFEFGQMGEAGEEAIVPLVRTPQGLGVRSVGAGGASVDNSAVVAKLEQVIVELRAATVQRGAVAVDQAERLDKVSTSLETVQRELARA